MKPLDLTGQKFGSLTVIERVENDSHGQTQWHCVCECGNHIITNCNSLRSGHTSSCGCIRNKKIANVNYKHGLSRSRIYAIWVSIKYRCSNPKFNDYHLYGGRGISVCNEWKSNFLSFYNWSINNGYTDNLTIDRIDPNGNYEPSNCRWVDCIKQSNNRRNNHIVVYHGKSDSLDNMCRAINVNSKTIRMRMKRHNLSFEEAVDNFESTSPFKEYWKST